MDDRSALTGRVLDAQEQMFCHLRGLGSALLTVDLTMPQMKTLLIVEQLQNPTGGQLARGLGVSLSTVTGIVDRLHEQGLVTRFEDHEDRRVTRVAATEAGQELVERLYRIRNELFTRLLDRLNVDQLRQVEQTYALLADAAAAVGQEDEDEELVPVREPRTTGTSRRLS
jgi:DNA-binding MarR family transcriptional regulator